MFAATMSRPMPVHLFTSVPPDLDVVGASAASIALGRERQ
jgi:hypothetical protein